MFFFLTKRIYTFLVQTIKMSWFSFLSKKKQITKINFEVVQYAIEHPEDYVLINTLPLPEQNCLIKHTIPAQKEEQMINDMLTKMDVPDKKIIVYGKNDLDSSPECKYDQLLQCGLVEVFIYHGGMFEWLLLQDIYGNSLFPTTSSLLDILKFKPI
jgi:hypothetical protein